MQRSGLEQDNKAWKTYSEKEDCAGWVTFCGWTTDGYHNREVPGFKRGPSWPRANWIGTVKKDLQKMMLTWEESEVAALDRPEWCRSVAQCIHLDVGWIKVKVKGIGQKVVGEFSCHRAWDIVMTLFMLWHIRNCRHYYYYEDSQLDFVVIWIWIQEFVITFFSIAKVPCRITSAVVNLPLQGLYCSRESHSGKSQNGIVVNVSVYGHCYL